MPSAPFTESVTVTEASVTLGVTFEKSTVAVPVAVPCGVKNVVAFHAAVAVLVPVAGDGVAA